jgi:hypothetical protein
MDVHLAFLLALAVLVYSVRFWSVFVPVSQCLLVVVEVVVPVSVCPSRGRRLSQHPKVVLRKLEDLHTGLYCEI